MLHIKQDDDMRLMNRKRAFLRQKGVKASREYGEWYFDIDEQVADMQAVRKEIRGLIDDDVYAKYFDSYTPATLFLMKLDLKYGELAAHKPCRVTGDIAKIFYLSNEQAVMELTTEQDGSRRLRCVVSPSLLTFEQAKEGKKICAKGSISFDDYYAQFVVSVEDLHVIDKPTALQEYINEQEKLYTCSPEAYEHKQIYPLMKNVNRINVLYNRQQALEDFNSILENSKAELEIKAHRVPFEDVAMAYKVQELSEANTACPICIIRDAASDAYAWFPFYSSVLVNTVIKAKAPILTGLGHPSDKPACTRYADYNAVTAQDLAMKLMYWKLAHTYQKKNKQGGLFSSFKPSSILDFFFGNK